MAAYCTKADLVERFGQAELAQLTDETAAQSPDDAEITKACDEATSLIDAYLAARYSLPLTTVPTLVRKWACDFARKFLWKDRARAESVVTTNFEASFAQLKDVAKGTAGLPDAAGVPAATSDSAIAVVAANQVFTDDVLGMMPG